MRVLRDQNQGYVSCNTLEKSFPEKTLKRSELVYFIFTATEVYLEHFPNIDNLDFLQK